MPHEIPPLLVVAAVVLGLGGWAVAAAVTVRRGRPAPPADASGEGASDAGKLADYQLLLETLDRSNVLLWWARVRRSGSDFQWTFRTPPQTSENPIYRLASLADRGYLWEDDQSLDREMMAENARRALNEGLGSYQHEFRIRSEGAVHWLSEEVLLRSVGPDEWNLAGVIVDVTKRRDAEEARRRTEGQLGQILKGADCLIWHGIVTGDPAGEIHWKMFMPPSVLFRRIFGSDTPPNGQYLWTSEMVEEWEQIKATSRRALREERPDYEQEFRVRGREASFLLHEHVSITRLAPDRWELVGVIIDITARREAELALAAEKERLAVTLESMGEGVVTIDSQGRVLFINRAASDLVQWPSSEAVGRSVVDVCLLRSVKGEAEVSLPIGEVLRGGIAADLPPQTFLRGRSGRMRLVEGRLLPVADPSSRRVGAVLVVRDVTERQRMEEQLQNTAKMESVGLLAGGIAHDFNNILTAILSNLTLLQMEPAGRGEGALLLDQAVRATKRAGDLTLQLLTFAKGGDPVRTAVQLPEIVRESATFAHRGSGVRSEFEMPAGLWAANVDKAQFSQVIQNLVINATQAMPNGGTIRIAASNEHVAPGSRSTLAGGDYVRISVADTGPGIDPEHLPKIFDPYFTTKLQGQGLGLATVFSIVRRHQGHIEVDSVLGRGATFTFWLPAVPAPQAAALPAPSFPSVARGGRVLFMDDELPIRLMAKMLMERMGLEFQEASDGRQAIDLYKAALDSGRRFDLVVMDLTIPGGIGGKEAIATLLQMDPSVRAVVSSGYSSDLAMSDFRKHGFRGMVAKPYDIMQLASVIRSVLAES